jgi:hypothetical protein
MKRRRRLRGLRVRNHTAVCRCAKHYMDVHAWHFLAEGAGSRCTSAHLLKSFGDFEDEYNVTRQMKITNNEKGAKMRGGDGGIPGTCVVHRPPIERTAHEVTESGSLAQHLMARCKSRSLHRFRRSGPECHFRLDQLTHYLCLRVPFSLSVWFITKDVIVPKTMRRCRTTQSASDAPQVDRNVL